MEAHPDVPDLPVVVHATLHAIVHLHLRDVPGVLQAVPQLAPPHAVVVAPLHAVVVVPPHVVEAVQLDVHRDVKVHQNHQNALLVQTHVVAIVLQIVLKIVAAIARMDVVLVVIMVVMIVVMAVVMIHV